MSRVRPCPNCKTPTKYDVNNEYRPFCSERCKLIDLGEWAQERYALEANLQDLSLEELEELEKSVLSKDSCQ